jgi:hypothetical protein
MGKGLTDKQAAVLNELFASELSEKEVLARHKISAARYSRWHSEPLFAQEFEKRTAALNRRAVLYIAKNASKAAEQLVKLVESKSSETSRKSCLDIIGLLGENSQKGVCPNPSQPDKEAGEFQILPELAGKLLRILAEEKNN